MNEVWALELMMESTEWSKEPMSMDPGQRDSNP